MTENAGKLLEASPPRLISTNTLSEAPDQRPQIISDPFGDSSLASPRRKDISSFPSPSPAGNDMPSTVVAIEAAISRIAVSLFSEEELSIGLGTRRKSADLLGPESTEQRSVSSYQIRYPGRNAPEAWRFGALRTYLGC